jgi:hypothetical protein
MFDLIVKAPIKNPIKIDKDFSFDAPITKTSILTTLKERFTDFFDKKNKCFEEKAFK